MGAIWSESEMATGSLNSSDSDVSLKSDQSKEDMTNFKDRVSPRRAEEMAQQDMKRLDDLVGPDIDPVGDHDDLMAIREAQLRMEKSAEREAQLRMEMLDDLIGPDIDPVGDHDDLMATGSLESNDSGVSMKSDRSKTGLIDFKDRVSPRPDFSSPEKKHIVSDDKDLVKSPDGLGRETNQEVG